MNETKCPHCGANMKQYWQRLTPGLVKVLVKFRSAVVRKNQNKIHVPHDFELSKTEYNNFQKLRYFALVAKYKAEGEHIQGMWLLTSLGAKFLAGNAQVPEKILTFRNHIVEKSEHLIGVKDTLGEVPYFETIDSLEYEIKPLQGTLL